MPLETTIKVDRDLRDRINAAAREQRMTPARFLRELLEEYELQCWAEAAVAEINASAPEAVRDDQRELRSPHGALADGLEDEPPYPTPRWIRDLDADDPAGGGGAA